MLEKISVAIITFEWDKQAAQDKNEIIADVAIKKINNKTAKLKQNEISKIDGSEELENIEKELDAFNLILNDENKEFINTVVFIFHRYIEELKKLKSEFFELKDVRLYINPNTEILYNEFYYELLKWIGTLENYSFKLEVGEAKYRFFLSEQLPFIQKLSALKTNLITTHKS